MTLTEHQIATLARTKEVHIGTRTNGKAIKTIIWIVVADGKVYVRSVRGDSGRWYERALADPDVTIHADSETFEFRAIPVEDPVEIDAVTAALREKYPPGGSLDRMIRDEVLDTTLRLEPSD